MIICTCPKCGADLVEVVYTTIPPKCGVECHRCGWNDVQTSDDQVLRVPYPMVIDTPVISTETSKFYQSYLASDYVFQNDSCRNCFNNPKNGGSGVCHCTLVNNIMY